VSDEEKLALLRIQLYGAAQLLKGEHLVAFAELIREIAMVLDVTAAPPEPRTFE
jgi:hypothetical protein